MAPGVLVVLLAASALACILVTLTSLHQLQTSWHEVAMREHGQGFVQATGVPAAPGVVPQSWKRQPMEPQGIESFDREHLLFVTFSNNAYSDLLLNWAANLRQLRLQHLVVCFDAPTLQLCRQHGVPAVPASMELESDNFRASIPKFRLMGALKAQIALDLFEQRQFRDLVLTDTDTVWLRDPSAYIAAQPLADMFISTDCLSHEAEVNGTPNMYRCGHVPGSSSAYTAYNTGMMILRDRLPVKQLLRMWRDTLNSTKPRPDLEGDIPTKGSVDDQWVLNKLLAKGQEPVTAVDSAPELIWAAGHRVRLRALPVTLFANGHVTFLQHLPKRHSVVPFAIHATFQREGNAGKRARLRAAGAWLVDEEPRESQNGGGGFMMYSNGAAALVARMQAASLHGRMADFDKHFAAAAYQLAALQHAMAIARVLNRTLILPELVCYCDQDQVANVLEDCTMKGSDLRTPFACPADVLVPMTKLDEQPIVDYRMPGFLQHYAPRALRNSRSPVRFHPRGSGPLLGPSAAGFHLELGATSAELQVLRQASEGIALLDFVDFRPAAFGGFVGTDAQRLAADFDAAFRNVFSGIGWCCSGGDWATQWQYVYHEYVQPQPVAGVNAENRGQYAVPWMRPPNFCDNLTGENIQFGKLPNHPCSFYTVGQYGRNRSAAFSLDDLTTQLLC